VQRWQRVVSSGDYDVSMCTGVLAGNNRPAHSALSTLAITAHKSKHRGSHSNYALVAAAAVIGAALSKCVYKPGDSSVYLAVPVATALAILKATTAVVTHKLTLQRELRRPGKQCGL
jgi:hypothetical protein